MMLNVVGLIQYSYSTFNIISKDEGFCYYSERRNG